MRNGACSEEAVGSAGKCEEMERTGRAGSCARREDSAAAAASGAGAGGERVGARWLGTAKYKGVARRPAELDGDLWQSNSKYCGGDGQGEGKSEQKNRSPKEVKQLKRPLF